MKFKILASIFFLIFLSSCSTIRKPEIIQEKLKYHLKVHHGVSHGDIVTKFDLASLNAKNTIFAPYYGKVINYKESYDSYIFNFGTRSNVKKIIEINSPKKLKLYSEKLIKINRLYNVLSQKTRIKTLSILKDIEKETLPLKTLSELHENTNYIPLFSPLSNYHISSEYGIRKHPNTKKKSFHKGIDLVGKKSSDIFASADGIIHSVSNISGYGNTVIISHSPNMKTLYAHLDKICVLPGQKVFMGEKIGTQGSTGNAEIEHLHFEIILRGKNVNPKLFLDINS